MSSSTTSVVERDSKPPAQKKARNGSATAVSDVAASGDGAAETASAIDPARFAEFLQDFHALKGEVKTLKGEVKTLKGAHDSLKGAHDSLKGAHLALEERLNSITDAFGPATQYVLFETAVYEFVHQTIPDALRTEHEGKIKYGIAALCSSALDVLLCDSNWNTTNISWQGPSQNGNGGRTPFPKPNRLPLVLAGLAGLVAYIELVTEETLKDWDRSKRNSLAHCGRFLSALYPGKDRVHDYDTKKADVKSLRKAFKDEASNADYPNDIESGVTRVVDALTNKGLQIDDEANRKAYLIKEIKSIA